MLAPDATIERQNEGLGIMPSGNAFEAYAYHDGDSRIIVVREECADAEYFYGFRDGPYGWAAAPVPYAIVAAHTATSAADMIGAVLFPVEV